MGHPYPYCPVLSTLESRFVLGWIFRAKSRTSNA